MKASEITKEIINSLSFDEKWKLDCGGVVDEGKSADIAILLGSSPQIAVERAKACATLYKEGRVKYIVPSGGVKWDYNGEKISEADLMKNVLVSEGVPCEVILCDNEARTTKENMICASLVIERKFEFDNIDSVIIVTSVWHMKRSIALAKAFLPRKVSISAYPSFPDGSLEYVKTTPSAQGFLNDSLRLMALLVNKGVVEDFEL